MRRIMIAIALLLPASAHAADWTKLRRISQLAGCATSMLDARSTLRPGLNETNPILGRGNPNAGRIIGLKLGICAGTIIASEWSHRQAPEAMQREKAGAYIGMASAGLYSGLAVRNFRLQAK